MLLIPSLKNKTKNSSIETLKDAADLYLSLLAYRGVMQPLVEKGQKVKKYQCIAQLSGVFAARLHAPVSGIVKDVVQENGREYIYLENDFQDTEISISALDAENITIDTFKEILKDFGIEGSGGSRFPTHMKYAVKENSIATLIINGVECEPYLSADASLMKEKAVELIKTAHLIQKILKAEKVVFVLEKQNRDIIKVLENASEKLGAQVRFCTVSDTYPQGGELQVIKSVAGIELKRGEIPAGYGIVVNNVGTLWAVYKAVFEGKPYTERVVTISGDKSSKQGNYWAKIGTPVTHLLDASNNSNSKEDSLIILGGAMMGKKADPDAAVHKGSGGILLLKKHKHTDQNCIKCGDCVDVCPQRLMPFEFVRHYSDGAGVLLREFSLQNCIECGACAYICPSNVPLMESIFEGKKMLL